MRRGGSTWEILLDNTTFALKATGTAPVWPGQDIAERELFPGSGSGPAKPLAPPTEGDPQPPWFERQAIRSLASTRSILGRASSSEQGTHRRPPLPLEFRASRHEDWGIACSILLQDITGDIRSLFARESGR